MVLKDLRDSRFYAKNGECLNIVHGASRSASQNAEQCYEALNQLIVTTAKQAIPGEASPAQAARVQEL
jgi:peptidyl-tRNA hydrolase ICT1